jgi:phage protein D
MSAINSFFQVLYNGKDISTDISLHLIDITYVDNVTGVADELEIRLEDVDGNWCNGWYPTKGATLNLQLGYDNGQVIKPNPFEIDEIKISGSKGSGDVVSIKALSGGIKKQLHTKRSHAHENKTLGEIVRTISARNGLTVIGNIANITIGRVTQHREKDLTFLNRLADEYGYAFSIKGKKLSFIPLLNLEGVARVAVIDKTDCESYEITDKGIGIYQQATVKSHNPNKNKLVQSSYTVQSVANNDGLQFNYLKEANNSLEVRTKTENEQQGNTKSQAALHTVNSLQQTADISLPGNVLLLAGNNIELTGLGVLSGIWNILKSTHVKNKGNNYKTSCSMKRIVPATQSGSRKTAKAKKVPANDYKVVPVTNLDKLQFNRIEFKRDPH